MLNVKSTVKAETAAPVRVLVVDDEPIIVKRLKKLLDGLGYAVAVCTDSEEAFILLEQDGFDLVITDLKMRKIDGFKILKKAKQSNKNIQVVVITGLGRGEYIAEAMNQGAGACLAKPFKMEDLKRIIDNLLK